MRDRVKKKFKETAVGKFLKNKGPVIIQSVAKVLPERGVFGIIKNIISTK